MLYCSKSPFKEVLLFPFYRRETRRDYETSTHTHPHIPQLENREARKRMQTFWLQSPCC